MKLTFAGDDLLVVLTAWESLTAFSGNLRIPRTAIRDVTRSLPRRTWRELRLPGTHLPGLFEAGSYRTREGWSFWYLTRRGRIQPLTLTLTGQRYARVVLGGVDDETFERVLQFAGRTPAGSGAP